MKHISLWKRALPALGLLAALVLFVFAMAIRPAAAAGIIVNSAADTVADDGVCTLREAITAANTDTASGATTGECAAGSGADTITFAVNTIITLAGSQLPSVTTEMTITGNGAANTIIQANAAANTHRVFEVAPAGNLTLGGVAVRLGRCNGACNTAAFDGGGILNAGTLTVTNSTLSGNAAGTRGGGIYNTGSDAALTVSNSTLSGNAADFGGGIYSDGGTVTVTNSTLSGNSANSDGGGIYNTGSDATLTVTNSTLSGNLARNVAGGILNHVGTVTVSNSTLSGNGATRLGGGILNGFGGTLTLTNSTLSGNSATDGGGISQGDGTLTVTNSTLSGNSADASGGGILNTVGGIATLTRSLISGNSAATADEIYLGTGTVSADAFNVFGDSSRTNAEAFFGFTPGASDLTATSDEQNVALANILSTTLDDNGGPTETHALVAGSPAIDLAPSAACAAAPVNGLDQRGEPRNVDIDGTPSANECDAGAYEYQLPLNGTIRIVKDATPADDTVFSFTDDIKSPNSFTLQDPSGDTKTFNDLPAGGSYTVTELDFPGWPLTNIQCSSTSSVITSDFAGGFITVNSLGENDTVTCTFTNTQCQPGFYDNGGNACVPADPGFYVPEPGATEQIECPAGTTSEAGAAECTPIPAAGVFLPAVLSQ